MQFSEDYRLEYFKSNYYSFIVRLGSSLSILFTCYKTVQYFLGIKYKNWLGSSLRRYELSKENNARASGVMAEGG